MEQLKRRTLNSGCKSITWKGTEEKGFEID